MAKSPKPNDPANLDPEREYRVTLTRTVPFGSLRLRPSDDVRVKGKFIAGFGDAVASVEPV